MARKASKKKGEQLDLIDVKPKNAKEILAAARIYKEWMTQRVECLAKEKEYKQIVLELVHKADLQPLEGGKIKFEVDGTTITITPRDELVQIKEAKE